MTDFLSSRLVLALLYLGALFAGSTLLLGQLRHVEGNLLIAEGMTESILVRESTGRIGFGALHGMPAEAIPFDNPRAATRRLDRNGAYDVVKLPFHVRLDAVEVLKEHPPRDVLQTADGTDLVPGESVDTPVGRLRFLSASPWTGLLRDVGGRPAIHLSVRANPDAPWENIVVDEAAWVRCESVIVQMTWCADEAAARASLPESYEPRDLAEWRVQDGNVEHFFPGVNLGTSLTLSDGSEARLMRFDPEGTHDPQGRPCIGVRFSTGEAREDRWIPANDDVDPQVSFHYPTGPGPVAFLRPFGYNESWVRVFSTDAMVGEHLLMAGEAWRAEGFELRLDEALATAVLVRAEDKAVYAALVEVNGETRQVREGETVALDGSAPFVYRRVDVPPDVRYGLTLHSPDGSELGTLTLAPGESQRFGNWRFTQAPNTDNVLHSAVIHVRRTLNRPATWVGFACFATGAVGLTIARLFPPRRRRRLMPPEA